jgi:hypothetical protein
MKPYEILREAADPRLLQYTSNLEGISKPSDTLAVFLWTNKNLRTLLKHGLNGGEQLPYITTPEKSQAGLGIINLATNEAAVGAIDRDGGVFIVSSLDDEETDARAFMQTVRSPKTRKLFSRLEDLEDLFKERDRAKKKTRSQSGDIQQDLLDANQDIEDPVDDEYLEITADNPKDAKRELEDRIKDLKKEMSDESKKEKQIVSKIKSGTLSKEEKMKMHHVYADVVGKTMLLDRTITGLETIISDNPDLFKAAAKKSKKDDAEDVQVDKQIEQWYDSLLNDFPGLDVPDAEIFNPNPETIGG